ncbi:jg9373 [Pararge aegeria aegeria]|uniref:Jg9373 protein n=1 Tax=Pararge aegeria aegeria TaxID=348720 RepID=A0A8S4S1J3_9NEOP|nr:jg9373 [Pararge aegeria aegeria]
MIKSGIRKAVEKPKLPTAKRSKSREAKVAMDGTHSSENRWSLESYGAGISTSSVNAALVDPRRGGRMISSRSEPLDRSGKRRQLFDMLMVICDIFVLCFTKNQTEMLFFIVVV